MPRDDPRLDPREVAERLGVHPYSVKRWRRKGQGPKFEKLGERTVRYKLSEVERFRAERDR